jgi:DNA-binding XRE family transcriptional regulator
MKGGDTKMTLQERMVLYRARNRINQGELARLCGVTKQTINSIEQGKQEPSRVTLAKIELIVGKEDDDGAIVNQQDKNV